MSKLLANLREIESFEGQKIPWCFKPGESAQFKYHDTNER